MKSIGIASLIYGASILLSRLIGLVRDMVVGRTLGSGAAADTYFAAFILPDFLNYLLASGVLSLVFIPIFQGYLARDDEAGGWRALSAIGTPLLSLALLSTGLLFALAPQLCAALAPGLDAHHQAQLVHLTRIILPAQIFHLLGGLISATLQARDAHAMPALAPLAYNLAVVLGGLIGGSAEGFSWGVLIGSIIGPFGLPLLGARRHGLRWRPAFSPRHPDLRRYLIRAVPVMLGVSIVVLDELIIKHVASAMEGEIARLQYARVLMKVPMGVFGMASGMAAFPTLARLLAEGQREAAWATLIKALRLMLLLAFAAQAALSVAGAEIAAVIWGEGRFTAADLQAIGLYTALLCLGLWAWSAQILIARGFYAQGDTWTPTLIGSGVMILAAPVYFVLFERLGGVGLALTSSGAISLYLLLLAWRLSHRLGGALSALLRPAALMAVAVAVAALLPRALSLGVGWPPLLRGGLNGGLALLLYTITALALGLDEPRALARRLRARARR
ncbi:murein biosynthesis integral membrane protein MurJ [Myxococcota bacterium]|nr:murein biosynthesis integral membrane protein MurJ [Myxococcota bacterium]MBU1430272.1 murein biosynthesis integral membrane protein MurJ [Myxococcota bacterium]MBU1899266.1 murein biosynthesis integral membrane protein MurJ [Myxococcota bacterium]